MEELVKEVLNRYCFKTNEKKDKLVFLFNGRQLIEGKTVGNSGIINMSQIMVIDASGLVGGKYLKNWI